MCKRAFSNKWFLTEISHFVYCYTLKLNLYFFQKDWFTSLILCLSLWDIQFKKKNEKYRRYERHVDCLILKVEFCEIPASAIIGQFPNKKKFNLTLNKGIPGAKTKVLRSVKS